MNPITVLQKLVDRLGSQKAAAAQLGISQPYLSDLLHGRRDVSDQMLVRLGLRRVERFTKVQP